MIYRSQFESQISQNTHAQQTTNNSCQGADVNLRTLTYSSVDIEAREATFGGIALRATIVGRELFKWGFVAVDIAAINAKVSRACLLRCRELASKSSRGRLLGQTLDIHRSILALDHYKRDGGWGSLDGGTGEALQDMNVNLRKQTQYACPRKQRRQFDEKKGMLKRTSLSAGQSSSPKKEDA